LSCGNDFDFFARHQLITPYIVLTISPLIVDGERDRIIRVRSRIVIEAVRARGHTATEEGKKLSISRFQKTHGLI
jgi:hypothetical protein